MSLIPNPVREQWRLALTLFVLFLLSCGAFYVWFVQNKAARLEQQNNTLTSDAAADSAYVGEYKAVSNQRKNHDARTEAAIAANPEWADRPLPDDVADLLRDPAEPAP